MEPLLPERLELRVRAVARPIRSNGNRSRLAEEKDLPYRSPILISPDDYSKPGCPSDDYHLRLPARASAAASVLISPNARPGRGQLCTDDAHSNNRAPSPEPDVSTEDDRQFAEHWPAAGRPSRFEKRRWVLTRRRLPRIPKRRLQRQPCCRRTLHAPDRGLGARPTPLAPRPSGSRRFEGGRRLSTLLFSIPIAGWLVA